MGSMPAPALEAGAVPTWPPRHVTQMPLASVIPDVHKGAAKRGREDATEGAGAWRIPLFVAYQLYQLPIRVPWLN